MPVEVTLFVCFLLFLGEAGILESCYSENNNLEDDVAETSLNRCNIQEQEVS